MCYSSGYLSQISKQHATQQGSFHARANRGIESAPRTWQKRSKVLSQRNGDMHSHIKPGSENFNCEINRSQRKDFCPAVADAYLVVALLYRKSWRCTFVANSAPGGRFDIPKCLIGRSPPCKLVTYSNRKFSAYQLWISMCHEYPRMAIFLQR